MTRNLADPDYEPSDTDLHRLVSDAFVDVAQKKRDADERLQQTIDEQRKAVLDNHERSPERRK